MTKQVSIANQWDTHLRDIGYAQVNNQAFLQKFENSPYIQLILKHINLSPASKILEPGCGSGKFSLALAGLGHSVVTLDFSSRVLHDVRTTESRIIDETKRVSGYPQGDLEQLPFSDNHFDLVLNEGVIEHWLPREERLKVLSEMLRVVKPGGSMVIFVPNGNHPLNEAWREKIYSLAPEMTYFRAQRLADELRAIGLQSVKSDGVYPWRSWTRLGMWQRLYLPAAGMDKYVPLPRKIREKWAMNLFAVGTKQL